jgi:non-specific serine/threonine protein kinase
LALEVAAVVEGEFGGRAWLVELASLADPALVVQTVAATLGVHEDPKQSLIDSVIEAIGRRQLLLLLDNCEHLIESCAEVADLLVRACPSLTILATSREPLGLDGEIAWRVPPLDVPAASAAEAVAVAAAAQLFVDRATAVRPGFQLTVQNASAIAKLCGRLDGIPLALELAAAWVSVLSVDQIVDRLDQALQLLVSGSRRAPARQQTLRATLDWSYMLLPEAERRLFESLSVFAGGWTLGSAESVCAGAPVPRAAVLDLLAQLVKKSLVMAEPATDGAVRYRLLEPVRQYAHERLTDSSFADEIRHRHALRFLELAEQSESALRGPDRAIWLEQLEREHDNLRGALQWAESADEVDLGLRLAGALAPFWALAGHLREGLRWLEAVQSEGAGPPVARAKVLGGVGLLSLLEGDLPRARANLEMSLGLVRELRDTPGIVEALNRLGRVTLDEGDAVSAHGQFNESLVLARAIGHRWGAAFALTGLAQVAVVQGDDDRARSLFEQALGVYRSLDSRPHVAATLANLASVLLAQGHVKAACDWATEALDLVSNVNDDTGLAHTLEAIGLVAEVRGRSERAEGLRRMATTLRSRGDYPLAGSDHAWPSAARTVRQRLSAGNGGAAPSDWSLDFALSEAVAELRTR